MTDTTSATVNNEPVVADGNPSSTSSVVDSSQPNTTPPAEKLSRRDQISAAFDKLTAPKADDSTKGPPTIGDAVKKDEAAPQPVVAKDEIDPVTGAKLEPIKAPASWTPGMRDKWSGIPRDMQKFITDRETHLQQTLTRVGRSSKVGESFEKFVSEYADDFNGYRQHAKKEPIDVVREVMAVNHALVHGSPQQKAVVICNLIRQFQPDPKTISAIFSGQNPNVRQEIPKPFNPEAEADRVIKEREEKQHQQTIDAAIDAFRADPKNEFFEDVRDLMSKAITSGILSFPENTPLPEMFSKAYEWACGQHPEVKAILSKRVPTQQSPAAPTVRPVQQAKPSLAAGNRSATPQKKMTRREAIAAAYDKMTGNS